MKTRICTKCNIEQNIKEFYPRRDKEGYIAWCKPCLRANGRKYRASKKGQETIQKYRKSDGRKQSLAKYNVSEKRIQVSRKYYETGAPQRYDQNRRKLDPLYAIKKSARAVARKLFLDGEIDISVCEYQHLGNCHGRLEMHHDDYKKPEIVRILCCRHHKFVDLGNLS